MSPLGSISVNSMPVSSRMTQPTKVAESRNGTAESTQTALLTSSKSDQNFLLVGSSNLSITKLSFADYDASQYVRRSIDGNIEVAEAIRHAEKPIPANDRPETQNLITSEFKDVEPQGNGFENMPIISEAETTALVELYQVTLPTPDVEPQLEMIA